mgnify:CR=1 FL=1
MDARQLKEPENPYSNMTDYESISISAKNFKSLEAAMADIYARDFMLKMGFNLKEKIPLPEFKEKLLAKKSSVQDKFTLI